MCNCTTSVNGDTMPNEDYSLEIKEGQETGFEFQALTDGEKVYKVFTDKANYTFSSEKSEELTTITGYVVYQKGESKTVLTSSNINIIRIKVIGNKLGESSVYFVKKVEEAPKKTRKPRKKKAEVITKEVSNGED